MAKTDYARLRKIRQGDANFGRTRWGAEINPGRNTVCKDGDKSPVYRSQGKRNVSLLSRVGDRWIPDNLKSDLT